MAKNWIGSKPVCNLCHKEPEDFFVDGRMAGSSFWALFCWPCWLAKGIGKLGMGFGQKYEATPPYKKVEG